MPDILRRGKQVDPYYLLIINSRWINPDGVRQEENFVFKQFINQKKGKEIEFYLEINLQQWILEYKSYLIYSDHRLLFLLMIASIQELPFLKSFALRANFCIFSIKWLFRLDLWRIIDLFAQSRRIA